MNLAFQHVLDRSIIRSDSLQHVLLTRRLLDLLDWRPAQCVSTNRVFLGVVLAIVLVLVKWGIVKREWKEAFASKVTESCRKERSGLVSLMIPCRIQARRRYLWSNQRTILNSTTKKLTHSRIMLLTPDYYQFSAIDNSCLFDIFWWNKLKETVKRCLKRGRRIVWFGPSHLASLFETIVI